MHVAYYAGLTLTAAHSYEISWEELVEWLARSTELADKMSGDGWSPVLVHTGARRSVEAVQAVTCAVLDLDKLASMTPVDAALAALDGLDYVAHSTHSHRSEEPSVRIVIRLSRPLHPGEWPGVWSRLTASTGIPADPTGKDPSRFYYSPAHAPGQVPWHHVGVGEPLDVDALLLLPGPAVDTPTIRAPARPDARLTLASGPVDIGALRVLLRASDNALIHTVLAGAPLPPGHDDASNRIAGALAFLLPLSTPWEGYLELVRPTFEATQCAHGFEHHVAEFRDMIERARGRKAEAVLAEEQAIAGIKKAFRGSDAAPPPGEDGWESELIYIWRKAALPDMPDEPVLKQCGANVETVLRRAPEWRGALRWNVVAKEIEVLGGPLGHRPNLATLDVECANWLARSKWKLYRHHLEVGAQLLAAARRNPVDPLRDYLLGLRWDGVERARGFLARYVGAEDAPHVAEISQKWFLGAVARALQPGCKMDNVLILEGAQGKLKSTVFSILAGPWFSDTPLDPGDKDSRIAAASRWVIEMAELTVFGRSDENRLKNFFSSRIDYLRPPFGRAPEPFERRAVCVGTTNRDDYLHDETGNRRYWSVRVVGGIDIGAIKRDRDSLWAEAVALYQAADGCDDCAADPSGRCDVHAWWLRGDAEKSAEDAATARVQPSEVVAAIRTWWERMAPEQRPREVQLYEVAARALDLDVARAVETRTVRSVASALRQLGFRRRRLATHVRWVPSAELLRTPQAEGKLRAVK